MAVCGNQASKMLYLSERCDYVYKEIVQLKPINGGYACTMERDYVVNE